MIDGWVQLAVLLFVVSTAVYWLVSIYARSLRREALEQEWETGDHAIDSDRVVATGLAAHRHSLRRRVVLLVYVAPAIAVAAIIYIMNFH